MKIPLTCHNTIQLNHRNVFKPHKPVKITMNKWLEIFAGLILVLVPIYVWIMNFWDMGTSAVVFFKGGLVWFVILIGVLFLMLGISDLKE